MLGAVFTGFYLSKLFSWLGGFIVGGVVGVAFGYLAGKGVNPLKWVVSLFKSSE